MLSSRTNRNFVEFTLKLCEWSVCRLNDTQSEVSALDKFTLFLQKLDILQNVTDEEVQKTETLLRVYGPMLRAAAQSLGELDEMCYEGRRQSITDFINLAIDYDTIQTGNALRND